MMSLRRNWALVSLFVGWCAASAAQNLEGGLKGQVTDESGAVIPNANVTVTAGRIVRTATTIADGTYLLNGLPPGTYSVKAASPGLAQFQNQLVTVTPGVTAIANIQLRVQIATQRVTVQEEGNQVSTEPASNANAVVLRGEDLEALPDDPDELEEDLQALAGPSAGPDGPQMYIDGFTGGRLPPKESIREVRINQNPFSAEYDRLGYGRIEILTKPGTDKFRGQTFFNFSDGVFNSRNPFAQNKAPFQNRQYGGNLSGPISRKSSFFVDFERRETDENAVVNAETLDSNLNVLPVQEAILTPIRRTTFSPRVDYAVTPNFTLTGRYSFTQSRTDNNGIGQFSLPGTGYNSTNTQHTAQLTGTAILGAKAVNETRFQYIGERASQLPLNDAPEINVLDSFTGGGSAIGVGYSDQDHYELQNYTSLNEGRHTMRLGVRIRAVRLGTESMQNFNGTFVFSGGYPAPELEPDNQPTGDVLQSITSLEAYRRTLLFQGLGYSASQIRALGGGASQFTISGGQPVAGVDQVDLGLFYQDDWRVKPNLTMSLGLRYETQTNIHDWTDFAPRVGFAWSPGGGKGRVSRMVIRGGSGIFYDRVDESLALAAIRYNGVNQQQFVIRNPDFFPNVPAASSLVAQGRPETERELYSGLRAPYIIQSAIGMERQLPWKSTLAVTFTNTHGLHMLRSRNINAPNPLTGTRPYPDLGILGLYESSGILNQNQTMVNWNMRASRYLTLFTGYVLNYARSDTDGASTYPANDYNLRSEYGPSSLDIRHRVFLGGSMESKWGIRLSPFVIARSGAPFNIYTGRDLNGDLIINDRPSFVLASRIGQTGIYATPWGIFNATPGPNDPIIPRNYGRGPGYFSVNLRVGRTFGFGASREQSAAPHGGGGGYRGGRHGPGGMRMGGGPRGLFGGQSTNHRYNLTLSISARNLLNNANYGQYDGNLSSPYFGIANSLGGGFGGNRPTAASNRRIDLSLRFAF
jgi:hypothetical protein